MAGYTPLHKALKDLNALIYQYPIDVDYGVKHVIEQCSATEDSLWKITVPKKVFQLYTECESGEDNTGKDTFEQLYKGIKNKEAFLQKYWASWWLGISRTKPFNTTDVRLNMNHKYDELIVNLWKIKPNNYKELLFKEPGLKFLFEKNVLEDGHWVKNLHQLKNNKASESMREWWQIGVEFVTEDKPLLDFSTKEKYFTFQKISGYYFLEPWFLQWQENQCETNKASKDWWGVTTLYVVSMTINPERKKNAIDTLTQLGNPNRFKRLGRWINMLQNHVENDKALKNQFGERLLYFIQNKQSENMPTLERMALSIHQNKKEKKLFIEAL